jgi:uncharacterized membrane protein HdeD (DUF308 family)
MFQQMTRPLAGRMPSDSSSSRSWWIPFIAGTGWYLFAVVVFRFDYSSVAAVATLFGVVVLTAAANELAVARLSTPGWRVVRLGAAVLLVVVAVVAFVDPGGTFVSLAAVVSFYFVLAGSLDISAGLAHRHGYTGWGLWLATGLVEVLLGLWAAGSWEISLVTLVGFVGGAAIARGTSFLTLAFQLKDEQSTRVGSASETLGAQ